MPKEIKLPNGLRLIARPGYFGRQRDQKIADLNKKYGEGKWDLYWFLYNELVDDYAVHTFKDACEKFYEYSYMNYLINQKELLDELTTYGECYDNAKTNIDSGLDYTIQEAYSTHIQDIAVRNVMHKLGLKFEGHKDNLLQIRGKDSNGYKFAPGNIPFAYPQYIQKPSKCPDWAFEGSVEDFWQSNKYIGVYK